MDQWFKRAIIYQVYPRSFFDTNNDGIGDLKGVIVKLPYLKKLGVNTIWINPVFVSPQVDNGYDVSNYFAIDSQMGTMDDFEELIRTVHRMKMRIIVDFVMNHTSDQHPWFQDAINNRQSIYHDYYLWKESEDGREPNNWGSFFGGSVWEPNPNNKNEYYFHLFDKKMPDLNWKNPEVQRSVTDIAKFWVKKGIDGIRLDAFIHIAKADFTQNFISNSNEEFPIAEIMYSNRIELRNYLRGFTSELKQINPELFILGEAASANADLIADYASQNHNLCDEVISFYHFADDRTKNNHQLNFEFQPVKLDLAAFKGKMLEFQSKLQNVCLPVLYWSNHDMARIATRYGDSEFVKESAKALATTLYLQRGVPIIYYGEEIGMQNEKRNSLNDFNDIKVTQFHKEALNRGYTDKQVLQMVNLTHKKCARGWMRWDDISVTSKDSVFSFYQSVLRLKQQPLFIEGKEIILELGEHIFAYRRERRDEKAWIICNLSREEQTADAPQYKKILLKQSGVKIVGGKIMLPAWTSIVLLDKVEGQNDTEDKY
ncbi:alpha-amylase family glycosyl hydrolase [Pediococcus stilesii]|uniref:Glycosyl hydrolase family 13 catalytic domain-containing protein n=1 Tax=Pediococcus stilesii TaxID=331679 RepID=A0A0R2KWH3_9LACO|nr:alpha-amylase family glycosyl hydrolase [Pediococcus stilesii]KRN93825.1 hypothetical protein IV81_GL000228 [Pediococcus stilesii]